MKNLVSSRTALLVVIAAALLVVAPQAVAKDQQEPIEQYRARAFNPDWGGATNLDIAIYEWTSAEERQTLFEEFNADGSEALGDALQGTGQKGFLKLPRTQGYEILYAWQDDSEGTRRIVLAVDQPMGVMQLSRAARTSNRNVSLITLELDVQTSQGEGSVSMGTGFSVDAETGQLSTEASGYEPTPLAKVKPLKK
jgi:hypothetical protein